MSSYNQWRLTENVSRQLMNSVGNTPGSTEVLRVTHLALASKTDLNLDQSNEITAELQGIIKNTYVIDTLEHLTDKNITKMTFRITNYDLNSGNSLVNDRYHADTLLLIYRDHTNVERVFAYSKSTGENEGELIEPYIENSNSSINISFEVYMTVTNSSRVVALYDHSKTLLTLDTAKQHLLSREEYSEYVENINNTLSSKLDESVFTDYKTKHEEAHNAINTTLQGIATNAAEITTLKGSVGDNKTEIGKVKKKIDDDLEPIKEEIKEFIKYEDVDFREFFHDTTLLPPQSLGVEAALSLIRYIHNNNIRMNKKADKADFKIVSANTVKKMLGIYSTRSIRFDVIDDTVSSTHVTGNLTNIDELVINPDNTDLTKYKSMPNGKGVRVNIEFHKTGNWRSATPIVSTYQKYIERNERLFINLAKYIINYVNNHLAELDELVNIVIRFQGIVDASTLTSLINPIETTSNNTLPVYKYTPEEHEDKRLVDLYAESNSQDLNAVIDKYNKYGNYSAFVMSRLYNRNYKVIKTKHASYYDALTVVNPGDIYYTLNMMMDIDFITYMFNKSAVEQEISEPDLIDKIVASEANDFFVVSPLLSYITSNIENYFMRVGMPRGFITLSSDALVRLLVITLFKYKDHLKLSFTDKDKEKKYWRLITNRFNKSKPGFLAESAYKHNIFTEIIALDEILSVFNNTTENIPDKDIKPYILNLIKNEGLLFKQKSIFQNTVGDIKFMIDNLAKSIMGE